MLIPLVSVGLYLRTGDPEQPDMPLTARLNAPMQNDFMVVVAKMEGHLAAHPDDGKALELMAPVWMRMGNAERALAARKDVIRLLGETADRRIRLAEAMANANNGAFPPEAYDSINRAMELEPKSPEVRYFAGAAAAQKGEFERARADLESARRRPARKARPRARRSRSRSPNSIPRARSRNGRTPPRRRPILKTT